MEPKISPLGEHAVRVERPHDVPLRALFDALKREPHVVDVVVSEEHVAIHFDEEPPLPSVRAMLQRARSAKDDAAVLREHVVPVAYDGDDLGTVAQALGSSVEDVIERHLARTYTVKMIGFLPGFAYLGDVDEHLVLPRRASPRTRVPAKSVAIAGPYTAVYPFSSPGGWHLLGHALAFPTFEMGLGDRVRFERASP